MMSELVKVMCPGHINQIFTEKNKENFQIVVKLNINPGSVIEGYLQNHVLSAAKCGEAK